MARTVLFFVCFVIALVISALMLPVWYVLGWLGLSRAQRIWGYHVSRNWARFLLLPAGVTFTVRGQENIPCDTAVLFVSNHQGNFDIPVLFAGINRPVGFLAKIELAKIPVLRTWMPKLGCVFIDRSNLRQSVKAMQQAVEVLKDGKSMVIFPEGTRSKGLQMGAFKKGSLRLVEKAGVPIVPVTVNGTFRAMEARNNKIGPARAVITIGEPIYYDRLTKEEQSNITDIVTQAIARNLE